MTTLKKKLSKTNPNHICLIICAVVLILGLFLRFLLKDIVSDDYTKFLGLWYEEIRANGLVSAVGNYNFLYQFLIFLLTKIPIKPLYAYKLLSVIFDILLAGVSFFLVKTLSGEKAPFKSTLAFSLVFLSPLTTVNSAAWAQCDSIYSFFALCGLLLILRDKPIHSMFFFGLGFAFKLQTVFFLPAILFFIFIKNKKLFLSLPIIPATMFAVCLPMLFWRRPISELWTVYFEQVSKNFKLSYNYPTVWNIIANGELYSHYLKLRDPAIVLCIAVLGAIMLLLLIKKVSLSKENVLYIFFILTYTCVLLLPAMHERYGFLYELLSIFIAFKLKKTIPFCISLHILTALTYCNFLLKIVLVDMRILSVINLILWLIYFVILIKELIFKPQNTLESEQND